VSDPTNSSANSIAGGAHTNNVSAPRGVTPHGGASGGGDFIDFYDLLGAQTEATTTALRRRINELYSEAQNNRDHRNPNKRRQYEALCELLPYCRIVLLDPDKRARYDRYMEQAKSGHGVPPFENMMDEIAGSIGEVSGDSHEKIGLLGTEGDDNYLPEKATAATAAPDAATTRVKPSAKKIQAAQQSTTATHGDATVLSGTAGQKRRVSKAAAASLMGSALSVIVFAMVCIVSYFVTGNIHDAIFYAAIAGLVTWIVTHLRRGSDGNRSGGNRISS
jgi:hypothetical protein